MSFAALQSRPVQFGLAFTAIASAALLASCGGSDGGSASTDPQIQSTWIEMGAGNQVIARAITASASCPHISLDGGDAVMAVRTTQMTVPQRTTASDPLLSKASAFPVTTCETILPSTIKEVVLNGQTMPLPKAAPQRIAVLADTGCRIKTADNAFQACSDGNAWPFATIAATIASMKPDMVMHIGDYHYRENPCPTDMAGCRNSPWGYGWDAWNADFFTPAKPLLAAAPWVVTRGNHEECARAGQGWARFLDVRPFTSAMSCDDPANDNGGNVSNPYAVALGSDTQIVLFDSAKVGTAGLATTDYKFPIYQDQFKQVAAFAADKTKTTLFANHHPILAYAPLAGALPAPGNTGLQAVMKTLNPVTYYPDGVKIALHGHVHDFQAINFTTNHPATFVAGNGGDNLDVSLPDPFPANDPVAPGAVVDRITHTNTFGFMMMERTGTGPWAFKAYTRDGKLLTTCAANGSKINCDKTGFLAP